MSKSRQLILALGCSFVLGCSALAVSTAQNREAEEAERVANEAVAKGDYATAAPALETVLAQIRLITDQSLLAAIVPKIERLEFLLAFCYVASGNYDVAIEQLKEFRKRYPNSPRLAQVLSLQVFAEMSSEQVEGAVETLQTILTQVRTPPAEKMELNLTLGRAYAAAGKNREAVQQLQNVIKYARDPAVRLTAISLLLAPIIALDDETLLYGLVPSLQGQVSPARFTLEFNLAAIQAADEFMKAKKYSSAFVLYKLCRSRAEIAAGLDLVKAALTRQQEALKADGSAIMSNFSEVVAVDQRLQKVDAEIAAIKTADDYDEGLAYRNAQILFEMQLLSEAYWAYLGVLKDFPKSANAANALYAAGTLAAQLELPDRAAEHFTAFLRTYPDHEKAAETAFNLAYLYQRRDEIGKMNDLIGDVIDRGVVTKNDSDRAHAYYLAGYGNLFADRYDEAITWFSKLRDELPDSTFREDADYWTAYTALFTNEYAEGEKLFLDYLAKHPKGRYAEDASYRVALARFGTGDLEGTRELATEFIEKYPTSSLRGEAHNLLGDVLGGLGDTEGAIEAYGLVEQFTDRADQVEAAVFNSARVMEATGEWESLLRHFQSYLARYGEQGQYTMAVYKMGEALRNLGREDEASQLYWETFERFSNDQSALGADLVLRDYIDAQLKSKPGDQTLVAQLESALAKTKGEEVTRRLRLTWGLTLADPTAPVKTTFTNEEIDAASPAVLAWMAGHLRAAGHPTEAARALTRITTDFPETDFTAEAMVGLGYVEQDAGSLDQAQAHFQAVYDLFPTGELAGEASMRLADILYEKKQFAEARAKYEEILLVREWRGPLWPEALYKIGLCADAQDETEAAFAYFQRVYVLYGQHHEWVAKAYLASGRALEKLGRPADAGKTYEEMLANSDLASLPAAVEVRKRLASLPKSTAAGSAETP